jgi:hypothetical protein
MLERKKMQKTLIFLLIFTSSVQYTIIFAQKSVTPNDLASRVEIQDMEIDPTQPPELLITQKELGIISTKWLTGKIIHWARDAKRGLYEIRGVKTPKGDYLIMFPDGGHYGGAGRKGAGKVNDMLVYRSKDKGQTWQGPTVAFDIDYNQHGFIPLIPNGSERIYAFGTQPIWDMYDPQKPGLSENAPIGYRYSDDDGYHWSEVRVIRPENDPGYRGMSVMRMCETDAGTWILGTHEGDWSYKPLMTRLYMLRSEDQGKTWQLMPHHRHGGWYARCFNRMDEGRPINLGDGKVMFMARTAEGHLWASWSQDDGKTWTDPKPTPLIHPDAPPMLFHLSDGETLIAFHHNRSKIQTADLAGNRKQHLDRSEIWFALSRDGGHTWTEPRFVFATALKPFFDNPWRDYNTSYLDVIVDKGTLHIFCPHRWERVLYLRLAEQDLAKCPTKTALYESVRPDQGPSLGDSVPIGTLEFDIEHLPGRLFCDAGWDLAMGNLLSWRRIT